MKRFKVALICVIAFFCSAMAFAYDGSIAGGYDGSFSRKDFIAQASNPELASGILSSIGEDIKITRFYQVTEDNLDAEDYEVINNLDTYINNNFSVKDRDGFSYMVLRSQKETSLDGWVVFVHYSSSAADPWYNYMYYFEISE